LLPYVVIPQIILGGGIIAVRGGLLFATAALLSPAYWAYRAVRRGACELPADFYYRMDYDDSVWIACAALAVPVVALLLATGWFLRGRDLERGCRPPPAANGGARPFRGNARERGGQVGGDGPVLLRLPRPVRRKPRLALSERETAIDHKLLVKNNLGAH